MPAWVFLGDSSLFANFLCGIKNCTDIYQKAKPNPFSDETYFTYVLTKPAEEVKIKIYATSGRLISELEREN